MRLQFRSPLRPVVAGWLIAVLLTLVSVASALADGGGNTFPH
jgi:hypothetical protein